MAIAREKGFKKVSLIVESDRPRLADYYATLGFIASIMSF